MHIKFCDINGDEWVVPKDLLVLIRERTSSIFVGFIIRDDETIGLDEQTYEELKKALT